MMRKYNKLIAFCAALILMLPLTACNTESVVFATDIGDGIVVSEQAYAFTASATYGSEVCTLEVTCNGILLEKGKNGYLASLTLGENDIILTAASGASVRTGKTYKVIYRAEFSFDTDIETAETKNDKMVFFASATFNDASCRLAVRQNGNVLAADVEGAYTAAFITGENTFELLARSGDHSETKTWTVVYDGFVIVSNLTDGETLQSEFSFRADAQYGEAPCALKATVNGVEIKPVNKKYSGNLSEGDNLFELTASVGNKSKTQQHTVRYLSAPPSLQTSIENEKVYKGSIFNFDVTAKDGLGKKLAAAQISFAADWDLSDGASDYQPLKDVALVWDDAKLTSFRIAFQKGAFAAQGAEPFSLLVTASDAFGRENSESYIMTYVKVAPGEEIGQVVFALEGFSISCGYFVEPVFVPIYEGVPFSKTLTDIITDNGWTYRNTGSLTASFYLSAIGGLDLTGNSIADGIWKEVQYSGYSRSIELGSSLGEFDYGSGSGWMYSANGVYKNYGFSNYFPQDGDAVRVQFTLLLGEDLGGGGALGGDSGGSILGDNPDYAPIMKLLAAVNSRESTDKTVYDSVIARVGEWNLSRVVMEEQITLLKETYFKGL